MKESRREFWIWAFVLLISAIIEVIWGPVEEFILRLSPISIWQLPQKAWIGIAATILASILSWVVSFALGGVLGVFSAASQLINGKRGWGWKLWINLASMVRKFFMSLYVIPLVLTLSVAFTILSKLNLEQKINEFFVGLILIMVSGIALAGQRIFIALDDSVRTATADDIVISKSLHYKLDEKNNRIFYSVKRLWNETMFLIGCKISLLIQAVEQAFHLAVVGVIILETTIGILLYEYLFPQEGAVLEWGGGIGRVIIDGQIATNPVLVSGAVWLILIFDSVFAWLIREGVQKVWINPYGSYKK